MLPGLMHWPSGHIMPLLHMLSHHHRLAVPQEELLLSGIMALAICNLLATLRPSNAQDYVFAAMFLMCTSTFLKIRWLVGTVILTLPLVLVFAWPRTRALLPADAEVHLTVSWAVGSLMSFLADSWRR